MLTPTPRKRLNKTLCCNKIRAGSLISTTTWRIHRCSLGFLWMLMIFHLKPNSLLHPNRQGNAVAFNVMFSRTCSVTCKNHMDSMDSGKIIENKQNRIKIIENQVSRVSGHSLCLSWAHLRQLMLHSGCLPVSV